MKAIPRNPSARPGTPSAAPCWPLRIACANKVYRLPMASRYPSGCPTGIRQRFKASSHKPGCPWPPRKIVIGLSSERTISESGRIWNHSRPPLSPYTRIFRPFSSPAATWLAMSTPDALLSNLRNAAPSSSRRRPGICVCKSAHRWVTLLPVTNSAILNAWVPISPIQPLPPD